MSALSMMNKTATVNRPTVAKEAATGAQEKTTASELHASLPCALQADRSDVAIKYERETGIKRYTLFVPIAHPGTGTAVDLRNDDEIVIDSTTFTVTGPSIDVSGRQSHYTVTVEVER